MLKTCSRCRSRRIKCDARLPSCLSCYKSSLPCTYYDEVLKENVPRSRIKSLYDKIDELSALVSMHESHAEMSGVSSVSSSTPYLDPFNYIVPYRTHQYLFLGPSPPVVLGNVTIAKMQQLGVQIESSRSTSEHEQLPTALQIKCDRNSVSPSIVRLLLTYYAKCIEPAYPTRLIQCGEGVETDLKQLTEDTRCAILLACATAAVHKSYRLPSWKALATACRDWAGDLAQPLIERRDDFSVFILIMFIVYELADPQRGLIWEFLSTATRICFQLGWNRVDEDPVEVSDAEGNNPARGTLTTETRRALLSVLINIERPLSVLSQRTPLLRANTVTWESNSDFAYNSYWQIIRDYFGTNSKRPRHGECPLSNTTGLSFLHILQTMSTRMGARDPVTHEVWLLLHPFLVDHAPCDSCLSFPPSTVDDAGGLHSRVLREATSLIATVHMLVTSGDVFIPPMLAASRAFMAACVLLTAMTTNWPGAETCLGSLLKCSEVLTFTSSLWRGGRDYFEIFRQLARAIP